MPKHFLALAAFLSVLSFAGSANSYAQTIQYTVSGAGGGTFSVDDGLTIFDNGNVVFTDGDAGSTLTHPPVTFMGQQGDSITDQVNNTYGFCTGLDPLYLSCPGANAFVLVDPGMVEHCGQPGGNQGISYSYTYTIPAVPGCGTPPIAAVEFTQAIQQYQLLADLKASLAANGTPPVPIIAGKPAVMRIYFTPVQNLTTYTVNVTGDVSGSQTKTVLPSCSLLDQRADSGLCYSTDIYFTPPSDTWTATITIQDSSGNQLEEEDLTVTSVTTNSMRVRAVGVCDSENGSGTWQCGTASDLLSDTGLLAKIAPTASLTPDVTSNLVKRDITDTASYPTSFDWWKSTAAGVDNLFGLFDSAGDNLLGRRTTYFGMLRDVSTANYFGTLAGIADGIPSHGAISLSVEPWGSVNLIPITVAHEIGHTLGGKHTNTQVPFVGGPAGPPGCWDLARDQSSTWPYVDNYIQSGSALESNYEVPFDVAAQAAFPILSDFEIMSYCATSWVSPFTYQVWINTLGGVAPSGGTPNDARRTPNPAVQPAGSTSTQPFWQVTGSISGSTVSFDPLFQFTVQGDTGTDSGTYTLQVQSATGAVLFTRLFTPTTPVSENGPANPGAGAAALNPAVFSELIPVQAGAAAIVLLDPTNTEIGQITITGTAPTVSITSPSAGTVESGTQPVTWTVSGPSTYYSKVLYSPDNGATWSLVGEVNNKLQDQIDFDLVPGSTQALIQVLVSDGVNTGSATSAPFSVSKKLPSAIVINNPISGAVQPAANPVYLSGAAYDADDGVLTGNALVWSDSAQGKLGSGSPLTVNLNPGSHTITLTATDSDGNATTATTNITLGGGRPIVTLTTNTLAANCVSATIAATPGSEGAALSTVQYSLNGGTSYTGIPLGQLPFSFVVPGNSATTLIAAAADLSRQEAAQSAQISLTGACITGVPSVSGGSTQNAGVGTAFPTPLAALISDSNGNPVAGVTVNFSAPASGASAKFSSATATSGVNGIASVTATANGSNGSYNVVATVPGFSTNAQFALTNTDFTLTLGNPSLTVMHGSSGTAMITVAPLSGFNSVITLGCTGLPDGVTCAFSPATLTPAGASLTSTLTVTAANNASDPATALRWGFPGGGLVLAFGLLGTSMRRGRKYLGVLALFVLAVILFGTTACGNNFKSFTSPFSVTATAGALQHSSSFTLTVQ